MSEALVPPQEGKTANLIYILYLASLLVGITGLVGLVMAYVNRAGAPEWVQTHYRFQIRTFWISVLMAVIGVMTMMIGVGFLILLFMMVWMVVRCVKGMKFVAQGQAHPNPAGWMFS
ncbi:putative membrane protein [Rhodospirillaceae bacterium LM-1]|nr:putative membrane protein [Rhodospirillaceae bacterium LM-1]